MDAEFEQRWRNSRDPFDGLTVTLSDYIPLALFQPALVAVVERLYAYRPNTRLFRLMDWHEHDGIILEAELSSWRELRSLAALKESLAACFRWGDTYVREGFFPAERDYYLRFYVPDPCNNPHYEPHLVHSGILDVTCQHPLSTNIAEALIAAGVFNVETVPAKPFFDGRYSG